MKPFKTITYSGIHIHEQLYTQVDPDLVEYLNRLFRLRTPKHTLELLKENIF